MHPDQGAAALAAAGAFPALGSCTPAAPAPLAGAWAVWQQPLPTPTVSAEAIDVVPKAAAPAQPYMPPALRSCASPATLAGCSMPRPAAPTAACPAPYVPPHRRITEQRAAAAAAPRPGRPCPFPALTAGPQPAPLPAPLPLYRLALLYASQPLQCVFVRC